MENQDIRSLEVMLLEYTLSPEPASINLCCRNWKRVKFSPPGLQREYVEVPCGKCIECRLAYSRTWAVRCLLEASRHDSNFFLTLTYDDEHLPQSPDGIASLRKTDMSDFIKALRQEVAPAKIRFFGSGEYGTRTMRPHLHIIVFGLEIGDLRPYKRSPLGDWYYNSLWLESIWKKGNIIIGEVNFETCAYTARYVMKKASEPGVEKDFSLEDLGVEPEFLNMSRRPGIGADAFFDDPDIYGHNLRWLPGGVSYTPPRYFQKLFDKMAPGDRAGLLHKKVMLQHAAADQEVMLSRTSLSRFEYLDMLEEKAKRRTKALRRDSF